MTVKTAGLHKEQIIPPNLRSYLYSLCLFLCLLLHSTSFSQSKSLLFDRLTVENGLSNPSVLQLMQDDKGFIWMFTPTGVVKYDGYQAKHYRPYLSKDHPYRPRIFGLLYQDSQGTIWLGITQIHRANLFRYDPVIDDFVPFLYDPADEQNPIEDGVMSLGEDIYGNLLVGTSGIGLFVLDKSDLESGKIIAHHKPARGQGQGFPSGDVFTPILMDKEGNNWMPTYDGFSKYNPRKGTFRNFSIPILSGGQAVDCREILLEDEKTLWVGTRGAGLWKFDVEEERFMKNFAFDPSNPHSLPFNQVYNIERGNNGQLWISGSRTGENRSILSLFDPISEKFTVIKDRANADARLPFTNIRDILADRSGNIWLATWQTGVFRHNSNKDVFEVQAWPEAVQKRTDEAFINSFIEDQDHNIWIGTEDGLWKWDQETGNIQQYRAFHSKEIEKNSAVGNMEFLRDDELILSYGNQLYTFDLLSKQFTKRTEILKQQSEFFKQSDGTLWAFHVDGICRVSHSQGFALNCRPNLLSRGIVSAIAEESPSDLWIGMNHSGLQHYNPKTDSLEEYISHYGIHDIEIDQSEQLWLITHSSGLKIMNREARQLIDLPPEENDRIGQPEEMVMTANGQFWITSSRGIVQFDPKTRKVLRRFAPSNWQVPSQVWHRNAHRSPFINGTGKLFFSSSTGILHFHPDSIQIDSVPPQIAFTDFYLSDERLRPGIDSLLSIDISYADTIVLGYQQNDFTIHFAALHYKAPTENLYQYRLDNHDPPGKWQPASTQRYAPFPNMRPGHYRFRVRAANSDGIWTQNEAQEAQLFIIIKPAWYANPWAYAVYLVLLIAGLILGYRLLIRRRLQMEETNRLRELEAVKSGLYTNITHEFRTPLTLILGQVQQIREDWEEVPKDLLDSISRNGKQLLRLVNQLLGITTIEAGNLNLRPVQSEIIGFIKHCVEAFAVIAKEKQIQLSFNSSVLELQMDFDPAYLKQVLDNLLSNAVKFTPEKGGIDCLIGRKNDLLILEVKDTGIGIRPEDLPHIFDRFYRSKQEQPNSRIKAGEGAGIGLAFTKELVELMNGQISVQSSSGQGASFRIELPITTTAAIQRLEFSPFLTAETTQNGHGEEKIISPKRFETTEIPLILIVEDHTEVRNYLRSCLDTKYQVKEAPDGQAGYELAQKLTPDLIISDVMMPKMDGFELCDALKNATSTSHIPVILLTAKADALSRLKGLKKGADAYLAKPFLKEELLIEVQKSINLREKLRFYYQSLTSHTPLTNLPVPEPEEASFVKTVRQIIEAHLDNEQLSVESLAVNLDLSRSQVTRKVKSLTGMTTVQFIQDIRLANARTLLQDDSTSVAEIAYQVGFSDPRYFSKSFKSKFGYSPTDFRKKI